MEAADSKRMAECLEVVTGSPDAVSSTGVSGGGVVGKDLPYVVFVYVIIMRII